MDRRGRCSGAQEHLRRHQARRGDPLRDVRPPTRASRRRLAHVAFLPEDDDSPELRSRYDAANLQANELLHRRVDLADAVDAHLIAVERAPALRFGRYIVSATAPFSPGDLPATARPCRRRCRGAFSGLRRALRSSGWRLPVDRPGLCQRAGASGLGWRPRYDSRHVLYCLARGEDFRSDLARAVGSKGYHDTVFADGPYPVLG